MTKRDKSDVLIANLGHHAIVFNEDDVASMLRVAVEPTNERNTLENSIWLQITGVAISPVIVNRNGLHGRADD